MRGTQRYRDAGAVIAVDESLKARWPGYRTALDEVLPGAFAQAVADAGACFESELPGLLEWSFGEAEARRITKSVLAVLGGENNALWPRFGETHQLLLAWLPDAEGFVLPGVTHFLQVEDPRGMAEALADFWARHRLPHSAVGPRTFRGLTA
jgi:3-oxoadipate enol-lactonase